MTHRPRYGTDERGVAAIGMAIGFTALIMFTAVAVDVGHLAFTATEVQTAAEVAATAGAAGLLRGGSAGGDALAALTQNTIDGKPATAANLTSLEVGSYTAATETFISGGTPPNAVRATATATVQNFLAGVFGDPISRVDKVATAAFTPIGRDRPNIPIAFGDCNGFRPDCFSDHCLPNLFAVPTGTSAWTAYFGAVNQASVSSFLPLDCGGSGRPSPVLEVGDRISLSNALSEAQTQALLSAVQCTISLGTQKFVAPIVSCRGNFRESSTVVGFATLIIDSVTTAGIDVHMVFTEIEPGPPGGGNFGTGFVVLVG